MSSFIETTWTDPETGIQGYVVLDTLVRGLASGGLRIREGCTLDEVRGLAQGMTRKESIVYDPADNYIPLGGGKGGIDMAPTDPRAPEVLRRFLAAMLPVIKEQWSTGEDFGLRQETLDAAALSLGLPSTVEAVFSRLDDVDRARAALKQAFEVNVDGISLGDLVGGYGVAQAAMQIAKHYGIEQPTAVLQGFGSIGGGAARYLAANGVKVIAIADSEGLIRNDEGLDVEELLAARNPFGVVDRTQITNAKFEDRDSWIEVPCDLLIPAAMSYVIDEQNAPLIQARVLVEGANMPTLIEAERALIARGIPVVPDFLTNVMTNAWWWWVVFGDIDPTAQSSFAKIDRVMKRLVEYVTQASEASGRSLRECAQELTETNLRHAVERVGVTGEAEAPATA